MFSDFDQQMMQRALELARRGLYTTHPNPCVGCVIANEGQIIAEGFHAKAGEPHAEVLALRQAGERARGSTVYVTLEPHCYHSKTPPCTDALIQAGVAAVICGTLDPNPKVRGAGVRQLESAGIRVVVGLLEQEARALNVGFDKRMRTGLPRVVVKIAASLDARVALPNGQSRWITSEEARADVQRLRARSSAILTGIGTVLADDPLLNVRDPQIDMAGRQPLRIVLDSQLRIPAEAKLLHAPGSVLLATTQEPSAPAFSLPNVQLLQLPQDEQGRVQLGPLWRVLGDRQCNEVLVEAGPRVTTRVLAEGWCDELILYLAPKLMGADAQAMHQWGGFAALDSVPNFVVEDLARVGPDVRLTLRPKLHS